jgi:hypothetical protein
MGGYMLRRNNFSSIIDATFRRRSKTGGIQSPHLDR